MVDLNALGLPDPEKTFTSILIRILNKEKEAGVKEKSVYQLMHELKRQDPTLYESFQKVYNNHQVLSFLRKDFEMREKLPDLHDRHKEEARKKYLNSISDLVRILDEAGLDGGAIGDELLSLERHPGAK